VLITITSLQQGFRRQRRRFLVHVILWVWESRGCLMSATWRLHPRRSPWPTNSLLVLATHCVRYLINGDTCYIHQHGSGGECQWPRYATSPLTLLESSPISPLGPPPSPNPSRHEGRKHREFADSSGPLFSMYWDMAKEEDKNMTECWQKDAKPIIIFVRILV
jgi:hypothetical protein